MAPEEAFKNWFSHTLDYVCIVSVSRMRDSANLGGLYISQVYHSLVGLLPGAVDLVQNNCCLPVHVHNFL